MISRRRANELPRRAALKINSGGRSLRMADEQKEGYEIVIEERQLSIEDAAKPQVVSETVLIARIVTEERIREEMGDVVDLARSIESVGLIHAVVVDEEYRLICGGRRLAALKHSGEKLVDVRRFLGLGEQQKRLMELEENRRRKDLTAYEWAKTISEKAEIVRDIARDSEPPTRVGGSGPAPDLTKDERVATGIGVSPPTLRRSEAHVVTAEQYPFMQSPDWSQTDVLAAKKHIDGMENGAKEATVALMVEAHKPKLALEIAAKIADAPPAEREEFVRLSHSTDERERNQAATWAASRAPEPDPRLAVYRECIRELKQSVKRFPHDTEVSEVKRCIGILESVVARIGQQLRGDEVGTAND